MPIDCFLLQMSGFGVENKIEYVENYFKESPEKRAKALNLLKRNQNLESLLNVAIYLEMICIMINNKTEYFKNNVKTGEIYHNLIDQILSINIGNKKFQKMYKKYMNDVGIVIEMIKELISIIAFISFKQKMFFISKTTITSLCRSFLNSPKTFSVCHYNLKKLQRHSFSELHKKKKIMITPSLLTVHLKSFVKVGYLEQLVKIFISLISLYTSFFVLFISHGK